MVIQKCDSNIIVDTRNSITTWCVFEHHVVMVEGEPPVVILVGACRLVDVYRLTDGKTNSTWAKIFENGGSVLVRIVGTSDNKQDAYREAQRLARDIEPRPRCNVTGYNLRGRGKSIICLTTGKRYGTQTDAADDLGIHGSALSRHLRGDLSHAQGFKFAYAPESDDGAVQ